MIQPVWQLAVSFKQISNRLSNRFDNRLNVCLHDTAGCTTVLTTGLTTLSNRVVQPDWQPAVLCVQPVVKTVECLYTRYNWLSHWFDNRLYCVNGASVISWSLIGLMLSREDKNWTQLWYHNRFTGRCEKKASSVLYGARKDYKRETHRQCGWTYQQSTSINLPIFMLDALPATTHSICPGLG